MTMQYRSLRNTGVPYCAFRGTLLDLSLTEEQEAALAERIVSEILLRKKNRLANQELKWQKEGF